MHRYRLIVALCAVTAAATITATAIAYHGPTRSERKGILKAVHARACEVGGIRVSRVDQSWALFIYGYAKGANFNTRPNGPTGRLFVHRTANRWRITTGGSDITCDQHGLPPRRVQRDLHQVSGQP